MLDGDVIVEPAPAKLNLALHVRRRRADGYHELETLFAFAADGDTVTVAPAEEASFAITGPFAGALASEGAGNLVLRAAHAFAGAFDVAQRHAFGLDKQLPVASGIGGGSADAAATLRALARLHGVSASDPGLLAIAGRLGADVPACLLGRPAFGSGRGDALEPLAPLGDVPVLLVNPGVAVSTAAVFAGWDGVDLGPVMTGGLWERALAGRNDLTPAALALAPVTGEVLHLLEAQPGATLVRMSGSGATCFAVFETAPERVAAAAAVRAAQADWWVFETVLT